MQSLHIPAKLRWLEQQPEGAQWLRELPGRIQALAQRWQLRVDLDRAFPNSHVSYVAPAFRSSGRVVLKVRWPDRESSGEADALRLWAGDGAVQLIDDCADHHALLIEYCDPGLPLSETTNVDQIGITIGLMRRLMKPAGNRFTSLAEEARGWAADLNAHWICDGKRCEKRLVDAALTFFRELIPGANDGIVLHQDLHGDNILSAQREPWLVIDPKPLSGDRNFQPAPLIRSVEFGHSRASVLDRFDRLSAELELDRDRVLRWTVLQTMAWSFDSERTDAHYDTVRWLLSAAAG